MNQQEVVEIAIIGSGPAGYSAAIYAARGGHPPVLFEGLSPGGQLMITTDIENYPGFADPLAGPELMAQMKSQAERVGAKTITGAVEKVDLSKRPFKITHDSGEIFAKSIIIATGAQAKWLGLESETAFMGRGVSGCATCDGFFYKDRKVAVIGGGDTAAEEALYLTNHATEVFLVHRRDALRASQIMADRVVKHPKITPLWNNVLHEVTGDKTGVTGISIKSTKTNEITHVDLDGVFVAIGHKPNTDFLEGQLDSDDQGYLVTKPDSTETSVIGVFAAGDVQDSVFRQAVTAAGTGCMAAIEASKLLESEE